MHVLDTNPLPGRPAVLGVGYVVRNRRAGASLAALAESKN